MHGMMTKGLADLTAHDRLANALMRTGHNDDAHFASPERTDENNRSNDDRRLWKPAD